MTEVPRCLSERVNGIDFCYAEWGDRQGPVLLLLHATGFHGRLWDAIAAEFADSMRVIAPDFRGHGRSENKPPYHWMQFGDDVRRLVEALDLRDIVVAGHSMGGHCAVTVAGTIPDRFTSLVLVDPVVFSPDDMRLRERSRLVSRTEDHPVAKRRNEWPSAEAMFNNFVQRKPFKNWNRRVLRDYCEHGLLPAVDAGEGLVLACPPLVEASVYTDSGNSGIFEAMPRVLHPVTVVRARKRLAASAVMDFSNSPTWPELASQFLDGKDVYLPDHSHFIPMESPELVSSYIRASVDAVASAPDADGDANSQ